MLLRLWRGQQAAVVEPIAAGKRPNFCSRTRRNSDRLRNVSGILVWRPGHVEMIGQTEVKDDRVGVGANAWWRRWCHLHLCVVKLLLAVVELEIKDFSLILESVQNDSKWFWDHQFFLKKMDLSRSLFALFCLFYTVDSNQIKICRCLDSNRGSLVLEATALPTEPQPLPRSSNF